MWYLTGKRRDMDVSRFLNSLCTSIASPSLSYKHLTFIHSRAVMHSEVSYLVKKGTISLWPTDGTGEQRELYTNIDQNANAFSCPTLTWQRGGHSTGRSAKFAIPDIRLELVFQQLTGIHLWAQNTDRSNCNDPIFIRISKETLLELSPYRRAWFVFFDGKPFTHGRHSFTNLKKEG